MSVLQFSFMVLNQPMCAVTLHVYPFFAGYCSKLQHRNSYFDTVFMFIVLVMMCVLCKLLVFVRKIADAIKPTRKK